MARLFVCLLGISTIVIAHDIEISMDPSAIQFDEYKVGLKRFVQIRGMKSSRRATVGIPDIPRIVKWVVIDPQKEYRAQVLFPKMPTVWNDTRLYPVQPDVIDLGYTVPFTIDKRAYRRDKWVGAEIATLGQRIRIGEITFLSVEITPFQYNPRRRQLRLIPDLRVRILPTVQGAEKVVAKPQLVTAFVRDQIAMLADNAESVLTLLPELIQTKLLVVTTPALENAAAKMASLHEAASVSFQVATVSAGSTPSTIKAIIQSRYREAPFDAVLLFGDESQLPLYSWDTVPGDVYYTHLVGNDYVADISLGRFPVRTEKAAQYLIEKNQRYLSNLLAGNIRKDVMLVAHQEDYPGKYTANQEKIFNAANPVSLQFNRQYGGAGATNAAMLAQFPKGFGIINYRGHGSNTEWWAWDKDSASFTETQIDMLGNDVRDLAIYFNIACDTGAIHLTQTSLAEQMLIRRENEPTEGAVAVVASTAPSYTEMNHRFDIYLFEQMQKSPSSLLGTVFVAASNRLVQDEGGAMPENVKMYLLLGHPLLPMPYTTWTN